MQVASDEFTSDEWWKYFSDQPVVQWVSPAVRWAERREVPEPREPKAMRPKEAQKKEGARRSAAPSSIRHW
jgi:hypothetical protein